MANNYSNSSERGMKAINEIIKMAGLTDVVPEANENNIGEVAAALGFTSERKGK